MKMTEQAIDRVMVKREDSEDWPHCPTYSPNFYIAPDELVIEFDRHREDSSIGVEYIAVRGPRFRKLKAGPEQRGTGFIEFGDGGVPKPLHDLVRQIALDRYRHAERGHVPRHLR